MPWECEYTDTFAGAMLTAIVGAEIVVILIAA
jgi:hypothetical protein